MLEGAPGAPASVQGGALLQFIKTIMGLLWDYRKLSRNYNGIIVSTQFSVSRK